MKLSLAPTVLALLAIGAPPGVSAAPGPQGGYTAEKHPDLGIDLPRARDYEQVPTQPDEEQVVLYYVEKAPKDPKQARGKRAELSVVWIDFVPDPPPPPPPDTPPETDEEGRSKAKPMDATPAAPPKPPITTFERFLEQRTLWALGRGEAGKTRSGYAGRIVRLVPRDERLVGELGEGWAYVFEQPQKRTIAFIGECSPTALEEQSKIWRYIAEHAEFSEPEGTDLTRIQASYRNSKYRGVEFRTKARSKLVRGWKAVDTENFIVVYHTPDQPLVRAICADIEAIRKEYLKLFPPAGPIDAVSVVRVCKDRGEYMAYGGMPGSAGYWNSASEELVFYDATVKEKGKRDTGEENTFIVLYHEALHQYIYYSAGAVPPHYWFNEGHGDYFSGADIKSGRVVKIGPNPWRIGYIKRLIETNQVIPWKDIVAYERKDFYDPRKIGQCYAQAWSMVYFLRASPQVQKHPQWSKILDTYFVALKEDYARRLELLEKQGKKDDSALRAAAGEQARGHALTVAFNGVDYLELQYAWRDFVEKLEFKVK